MKMVVIYALIGIVILFVCFNMFSKKTSKGPDREFLQQYYDELAVNPNSATAYMEIARDNITEYPEPYDLEKALKDINKAIELDPNLAEAYALRALLYDTRMEKPDLALQDLNKAIELDPKDVRTYIQRADIYYEQGKLDLYKKDLDTVLEIDPENKDVKFRKESMQQ